MGVVKISLIVAGLALLIHFIYNKSKSSLPILVNGHTEKDFEVVKAAFRRNFESNWESEGASFAVFYKGKKVVDLWGGYGDIQSLREWKEDTMSITFSTTKAVAALCVAMLVDRGRVKYDDLVSKHWPAFANNGKSNITVQMALSHMAGLPYFDTVMTEEISSDHNQIRKIIENEKPKWPPGTESGYHAFTYGWIVDQIVRHVDEKKRGVGQFMREEITQPNETHRVARLSLFTLAEWASEVLHDLRMLEYLKMIARMTEDSPMGRAMKNVPWMQIVAPYFNVNNPEYYRMEQSASLGIGNARSLAEMFNLAVTEKLLSRPTLEKLQKFHVNGTDSTVGIPMAKGHGYMYHTYQRAGAKVVVGHSGYGCQEMVYDLENQLVIAYVSNALKAGAYDRCRTYWRLQTAVYDAVENIKGGK